MIKTTSTLSCKFKDNKGKARSMNIDNPSERATAENITGFMERVIQRNMFCPDKSVWSHFSKKSTLILRFKLEETFFVEDERFKTVKFKGMRENVTDEMIREFILDYCELTANILIEAIVVDERSVFTADQFIEIEEMLEVDAQEKVADNFVDVEEVGSSGKRVGTAPKESEVSESENVVAAAPLEGIKVATTEPEVEIVLGGENEITTLELEEKVTSMEESEIATLEIEEEVTSIDESKSVALSKEKGAIKVESAVTLPDKEEEVATLEVCGGISSEKRGFASSEIGEKILESKRKALLNKYGMVIVSEVEDSIPSENIMELDIGGKVDDLEESLIQEKQFIMPVKKRKMRPPVGKRTKSRKKAK